MPSQNPLPVWRTGIVHTHRRQYPMLLAWLAASQYPFWYINLAECSLPLDPPCSSLPLRQCRDATPTTTHFLMGREVPVSHIPPRIEITKPSRLKWNGWEYRPRCLLKGDLRFPRAPLAFLVPAPLLYQTCSAWLPVVSDRRRRPLPEVYQLECIGLPIVGEPISNLHLLLVQLLA